MNAETPKAAEYPKTLMAAIQHFSKPGVALQFFADLRWPNGACCPHCGSTRVVFLAKYARWECKEKHARRQFTVKVGTIMEDSPLPLDKWAVAMWLEGNAKNSISSYEVHRALGITQKSAWFMQQRIRLAMQQGDFFKKLTGDVEVDETFIGGKARNMHAGKRKAKGRGAVGKAVVMGLLERHTEKGKSKVRTVVVENTKRKTLKPIIIQHVETGTNVYTDALKSYQGLDPAYVHSVIDHAECYVKGNVHTNGLENYWALFKRCIKGTHVSVEPFHLFRYLDAEGFRFNNRELTDGERFLLIAGGIEGKRLTYKQLIGEATPEQVPSSDSVAGSDGPAILN
jgi:transposase-like protein